MKKKNEKLIRDLNDVPKAWEKGNEDCCEFSLDPARKDPYVEIYARWRAFMLPLSETERKFVKKLVCGDSRASKEEVDAWVKATKGQLDKGTK